MKLCSLASGSSGNSIYVGTETTDILIDAGISCKAITTALASIGVSPDSLDAVVVTHEHTDHVKGLESLSKRYWKPIYATAGTIQVVNKGQIDTDLFQTVWADESFTIGDITVHPFRVSHDVAAPVGYVVEHEGTRIGICTDLGCYNDYTVRNLSCLDAVLVEFNFDRRMLEAGPYPYPLKRRIAGEKGHLSNDLAVALVKDILTPRLKLLVLAHLSEKNNLPELAYETARIALSECGREDVKIVVAGHFEPTEVYEI